MTQLQQDDNYSASFLGVPDGAVAYFPLQQGIAYTYDAKADKWIGENKSWCSREPGQNTGRGKYFILTVQWLSKHYKASLR
jgi:hypothetical protein